MTACTESASPQPGLDARMQIPGAQYRPGPFPRSNGGPATASAALRDSRTTRGVVNEKLDGVLAPDARAAIVGLLGTDGAWIVPAGPPDTDTPDSGSLHVTFGLTEETPPGQFTLLVSSVDAQGRIGDPFEVIGMATDIRFPTGTLVVGLNWTGPADLDLHVIDPLGGEAFSEDPNTWEPPPPGTPVPPDAHLVGGILDHDGNSRCAFDGMPDEHVAWSMPAPAGEYIVRVEARSMCGAPIANWAVTAYTDVTFDDDGHLIGSAEGYATPYEVLQPHGRGAGVTALKFRIPSP